MASPYSVHLYALHSVVVYQTYVQSMIDSIQLLLHYSWPRLDPKSGLGYNDRQKSSDQG